MLIFLKYLKLAPFILLAVGAAYAAHYFIVTQLENKVLQLESAVTQYQEENAVLKTVAATNEQTIRSLEQNIGTQIQRVTNLTTVNQQLQSEKDEYLSIFRRHDLQRLALARQSTVPQRFGSRRWKQLRRRKMKRPRPAYHNAKLRPLVRCCSAHCRSPRF